MKHIFPIALCTALVVVGGAYMLQQMQQVPTVPSGTQSLGADGAEQVETEADAGTVTTSPATVSTPSIVKPPTPAPTPKSVSGFTSAQVAQHASSQSCWSSVNGNVYDLTSWIGQHPGGASAIRSMCGHDASAAFNGQHGGQRRPASELAGFLLGPLR